MAIELVDMTRARMHELYQGYVFDPCIFRDRSTYVEMTKGYRYSPELVDKLYDARASEDESQAYAILHEGRVIGEVGLRDINQDAGTCELSIQLQNDSVKGKGYGTMAERMAIDLAFSKYGLRAVTGSIQTQNRRSQHIVEKLGFQLVKETDGYKHYILDRKDWRK